MSTKLYTFYTSLSMVWERLRKSLNNLKCLKMCTFQSIKSLKMGICDPPPPKKKGTFFKVGGHSGGMSQNIFWGARNLCEGAKRPSPRERSDPGAGASIHFSDGGGGGGQKLEKFQNFLRKICNITLCARSAPKNWELCMFSIILMLNLMVL